MSGKTRDPLSRAERVGDGAADCVGGCCERVRRCESGGRDRSGAARTRGPSERTRCSGAPSAHARRSWPPLFSAPGFTRADARMRARVAAHQTSGWRRESHVARFCHRLSDGAGCQVHGFARSTRAQPPEIKRVSLRSLNRGNSWKALDVHCWKAVGIWRAESAALPGQVNDHDERTVSGALTTLEHQARGDEI